MNSLSHIQEPSGQTPRNSSASRDDGNASSNLLLLDLLADYILDSDEENAIRLLESLDPSALRDLEHYRVGDRDDARGDHAGDSDVSLLQLASAYSVSTELISLMALKCPVLLTAKRQYPYEGQTALHTLVSKENVRAVDAILKQQGCPSQVERLLKLSTVTVSVYLSVRLKHGPGTSSFFFSFFLLLYYSKMSRVCCAHTPYIGIHTSTHTLCESECVCENVYTYVGRVCVCVCGRARAYVRLPCVQSHTSIIM